MDDVIIIGAGAAGLMAARCLSAGGIPVVILEAKERVGGRICTLENTSAGFPIELGAEFVHGRRNDVWNILQEARLEALEATERHWRFHRNQLIETGRFWERLAAVTDRIGDVSEDRDVLNWLMSSSGLTNEQRQLTRDFVEGFHAAPAERMSLKSFRLATRAAEAEEGDRSFRIPAGYHAVLGFLLAQALSHHARLHVNSVVETVRWEKGAVQIQAQTARGRRLLHGAAVLITVPLGVLRNAETGGGIVFDPEPAGRVQALNALEMGHVVKVTLQFRSRFWPVADFGFIHSDDEWFPTWWSHGGGPLLTAWAGGPRAEWLVNEDEAAVVAECIRALSRIFNVSRETVADALEGTWWYNWSADRFATGAYSYTPVGAVAAPARLGQPVGGTLFFAGEATDCDGDQGTVHGALASGERAAAEILREWQSRRRPTLNRC